MASRFLITGGGSVTWDASNTAIWSASDGGATGASVPVDGDTVSMTALSGGGTVTLGYNPTVTSITGGAFTGTFDASTFSPTMDTFNFSGTGTRTLNMGSGTWTLRGNNTTIWNIATATNLTLNTSTSTVNCTYSGATGTRTIASTPRSGNFKISAGTDTISGSGTVAMGGLDFTGFSGIFNNANSFDLLGSLTMSPTMSVTSTVSSLRLSATTSATITTNGVQINIPITIQGVGGTYTLQDNLNMDGASQRTLTLTNGTFNANNFNVTCGIFSSSNSNTRTLTMGSGTWTLTGNNANIFNCTTQTGLSCTATLSTVICNYSGSTGTRSVATGSAAGVIRIGTFKITSGSDIFNFNSLTCNSFDFTGFTGSTTGTGGIDFRASSTLGTGQTWGATGTFTYSGTSGTAIFTSNSVILTAPLTINGMAGTFQFADAFSVGVTNAITLTNGTLDTNNRNVTSGSFSSSNSNVRTLTMGSGTWTLTGTGTVWNITTGTNMTFDAGTSTIVANNTSSSSKTFAFNAMTYYNLRLTGAGTGTFILGVSTVTTTFNNITVDTPPHTVQVFAGKTIAPVSITWSGTAGNLNTFQSTINGVAWNIVATSGTIAENYISLQDSHASGGALFYAGNHSTDVSGNTGWIFTQPVPSTQTAARDENGVKTLTAGADANGSTPIRVYANASNNSLSVADGTTGVDFGPENAPRDENGVPVLLAVSSADGVTPVVVYADSVTHELLIQTT